jgi:L-cysteine/cystine lyase
MEPMTANMAASSVDDRTKIAAVRTELPATQRRAYLNTGTNGPLPRRTHEALMTSAQLELAEGRIGMQAFERFLGYFSQTRTAIAGMLGCDVAEVALTHNTTEGMNIALMGLDWRPGDEVVSATAEHPGGLYPLYLLRDRFGVKLRMTEIGLVGRDPIAELRSVLSQRTRAVVLSHVSWASGMVLPVAEMAEITHRAGALFICDAAQSAGMVPSNVYALGVDAYACSGQKWLCGPDGTGALFVRKDRLGDIHQTFMGYMSIKPGMCDREGYFVPSDGARRFEVATLYPPSVRGLATSVRWIGDELGWPWVYNRIAWLGRYCFDTLASLEGVSMLSPRERLAGLVHFRVEGMDTGELTKRLQAEGILIRDTHNPEANRVSTGFYNTTEEIDRLAEAIQRVR